MEFRITERGNLELSLSPGDKDQYQEVLGRTDHKDHGFLADMLEREGWLGNGKLAQVRPEWIGALTDAPILTESVEYVEGSDMPRVDGDVWWFPAYERRSFAEDLLRDGSVVFDKASLSPGQHHAQRPH